MSDLLGPELLGPELIGPDLLARHGDLIAVLLMAAVTYGLRAGGYWVMGRVPLSPRVQRGLDALPGCVIAASVVPAAAKAGLPGALCVAAAALVMRLTGAESLALAAGLGAAAGLRALGV